MAKENIDGGLIGGASLKVADFDKLMRYNQSLGLVIALFFFL